MFIGHIAVGFAGKTADPEIKIGTSILAATAIDLLFNLFLVIGWERVSIEPGNTAVVPLNLEYYPWSHSLVFSLAWAVVFGLLYYILKKRKRGALWIAAAVFSHWVLDFASHGPDLPLWPGGPKVGLGLWNSVAGTVTTEITLFALGVFLYCRATGARNRWGHVSLWGTVSLLALLYCATTFGPPPPSVDVLKWMFPQGLIVVLLGYWMDRTRENAVVQ